MKKRITFGLIVLMVLMCLMGCSGDSKKDNNSRTELSGKSRTETKEEKDSKKSKDDKGKKSKDDEGETSSKASGSFLEQYGYEITPTGTVDIVALAYNRDPETNTLVATEDFTSTSTISMSEYEDEEDPAYKYIDFSIEMDLSNWSLDYNAFILCTSFMDRDTGYSINYFGEYDKLKTYTLPTANGDIQVELIGSSSLAEDCLSGRFAYSLHCPADYDGFIAGVIHANLETGSLMKSAEHRDVALVTENPDFTEPIKKGYAPIFFSATDK